MNWKICEVADGEWEVRLGDTVHFAQSAESAVALYDALIRAGR